MTVTNPASKVVIVGDGVTTVFSYTFQLPAGSNGSDIFIFVFDDLGNMYPITSNYTLNLAAAQVSYPTVGGISPLALGVNALPAGWEIVIVRIESLTQALNLVTQGPFSAAGIMAALDMLTFICQQLQEQLNRAVLLPMNTPESTVSPVIAPSAGVLIQYNNTFANLVAIAAAAPTTQFWGFATDRMILYFYTGNTSLGSGGFIASGS